MGICMNYFSINSEAEKIEGGFHKHSAYFHHHHFNRKWGSLDYLFYGIYWERSFTKSRMSFISYVEIYEK